MLTSLFFTLAQATAPDTPTAQQPLSTAEAVEKAAGINTTQMQAMVDTYGIPVLKAFILLIIGWLIAGWLGMLVRKVCERAKFDLMLGRFLGNLVKWLVLAAVVIMCLSSFGVQVTSLVALLGTIGVAIGLALQGSLSHIASGVMLLIFRPFKIGDFVTAAGQTGIVEEVGLFSTLFVTPDNRRIIIPNGAIINAVITNATHFDQRLIDTTIAADPAADIDRVRSELTTAAESVRGRTTDKAPGVSMTAMGTWAVSIWCKTAEADVCKERLIVACNQAIGKAGFAPPAPVALVKNV